MPERCAWAGPEPIYIAYHDTEWGVPEHDGRALWEKLVLDGFQAGLSWITILKKRDNFRSAFRGFDPAVIAEWGEDEVRRLLSDPGIIRHRGKIEAVINNARRTFEVVQEEGSFAAFIWLYEPAKDDALPQMRSKSTASETLSKDLRKLGFKFVGPTTVYAFMPAMGCINDHAEVCWMRKDVETARNTLRTPT